ncbi:MAG: PAS domain S-box protein, partial [Pseudomonadota bacterium]|nr:PAS domain S-box protein [Pseudomonadota bacterium]
MSKIITPKNHEVILEDEDIIVSKTDLKGRITYANRIFMRISGYNEEESLGHPHNIIRHPDMPRGVYYFMWKTLQAEHEFFGF